ncbi:MAG: site-2 protease family protein, partial [Chloroflexota bacterium]|nr:site-2 protease family protein [Chloroflexota bacterium]
FGHYITARMVGVKVEEFGIGIPPRIKGWQRRGVIWSINAIPFGGFVRVLGEDGKSMEPGSMNTKSPGQRAFFLAAGSGMNVLLAGVLMIFLVGIQGVPSNNAYIDAVSQDSPAALAGWQSGDRIVEVAGVPVQDTDDVIGVTREYGGRPMNVVVERGGQRISTTVTPREDPPTGQGPTGINLANPTAANIYVGAVAPGSPAEQAGIQAGDRILAVNGREVEDNYAATFELDRVQGQTVPVTVAADEGKGEPREVQLAVPVSGLTITEVEQGSAAATAGWKADDRLVSVAGQLVTSPEVLASALEAAQGTTVPAEVIRGAAAQQTQVAVPDLSNADSILAAVGINASLPSAYDPLGIDPKIEPRFEDVPAGQVIPRGFREAYDQTVAMIQGIRELVTSRDQWDQVAGPIGMGQITSETIEASPLPLWSVLTQISIVLSLNLAVLNLLPLPALDGGRLFFVLIEILRGGRRIAPEKEGVVHFFGLVVLLGLMFVIAFFDVDRIVDGRSFLP